MKKLAVAAVLASMVLFPTMASAAPQVAPNQSQQHAAQVVSPDVATKYVSVSAYYSDPLFVPSLYYYSDGMGYSGWLYLSYTINNGMYGCTAVYSGTVTNYNI